MAANEYFAAAGVRNAAVGWDRFDLFHFNPPELSLLSCAE